MSSLTELLTKSIQQAVPSAEPDQLTESEDRDLKLRKETYRQEIENEIELKNKKQDLKQKKDEHKERVKYAKRIYLLICAWLVVLLLIVIASATNCKYFTLYISDRVLITLLTTTTVTVLGLFITVLKYIYARKN